MEKTRMNGYSILVFKSVFKT
uniref:Uncharacterized protein n=1 Tax=Anguilla anguilla TaxID=7936 RepID=A0A0E9P563_ANGAN